MTPCPRSRHRAARASSFAGQTPSHRGDPWPEQGSRSPRDPTPQPDPTRNTPGDSRSATHVVRAATRWSDLAARAGRTWASASPIIPLRSIAANGICAELGASLESCPWIYARQPPSLQWKAICPRSVAIRIFSALLAIITLNSNSSLFQIRRDLF